MKSIKIFVAGLLLVLIVFSFVWIFLPLETKADIQDAFQVGAALSNHRATKAMKAQDLSQATNNLAAGLATSPENPSLHFNLGLVYQLMKKGDEAEKSYKQVQRLAPEDRKEQFMVEYNLGRLHQEAKEVDKALEHYQKALNLADSRETRINIELLIQQSSGGGKGESKDQKDKQEGEGEGQDENKNPKYQPNQPQQKPQFKSQELTPSDVNKILGELKQQEQRIRGEYNRRDAKEPPRGKDW